MTAVLYDPEVVTAAPAPKLTVVRDEPTPEASERSERKVTRRIIVISDPVVDGAAQLLSIGVRHVYAALWRVGVLEVT